MANNARDNDRMKAASAAATAAARTEFANQVAQGERTLGVQGSQNPDGGTQYSYNKGKTTAVPQRGPKQWKGFWG